MSSNDKLCVFKITESFILSKDMLRVLIRTAYVMLSKYILCVVIKNMCYAVNRNAVC